MLALRSLSRFSGNQRGQAVIEFALVMPLLLLLVFGATEFSRAWLAMNTISAASREGCRLAVVTPAPPSRWSGSAGSD